MQVILTCLSTSVSLPFRILPFQIAMKNGVIQKWGLVEFKSSSEAEETLSQLNGHDLHGHKVRIQYAIPGVHAITIYMRFVNNPLDAQGERKALMEETPSTKVRTQASIFAFLTSKLTAEASASACVRERSREK